MRAEFPLFRQLPWLLAFGLNTTLHAQQVPNATTQESNRAWIISPRVTLTETATDNANIDQSSSGRGKTSDLITEIAPGIRIEARTRRLKGHFDYALSGQFYANQSGYSRTQNSLNSFATLEAIDDWMFVDFSGQIAQQSISAFGNQSVDNGSINSNRTETSSYRMSPYIKGELGGLANYLLRYSWSTTQSGAGATSNVDLSQWNGQLAGSSAFRNLDWTLTGSQQTSDYSNGQKSNDTQLRAMLTYSVLPEFRVSVSGGTESNNYASLGTETHATHGYGFDWNPTPRTKISAFRERRFFGNGHDLSINHRFRRSSVSFTDTRDVSVLPNQFATTGLGTIYQIYYQLIASIEPYASMTDPVAKDIAVSNAVNTLLAVSGINPNAQVTSGFLTSRATVQHRQQLAFTFQGARNAITLIAERSQSQSIQASSALNDNFDGNSVIRQRGLSLNLSHRLSPLSSLNVLLSRQESTGDGLDTSKTTTSLYQAGMTTKLGAKTSGSLSARHSKFDGSSPYTENALIGTLSFVY